jgi:hypothetical protein
MKFDIVTHDRSKTRQNRDAVMVSVPNRYRDGIISLIDNVRQIPGGAARRSLPAPLQT